MAVGSTRGIRLGLRSSGLTMTAAEFDAVPLSACDRRYRYQLIRGVLVVTPPAGPGEVDPNDYLGYMLLTYKENDPRGLVLDMSLYEQTIFALDNRRRCDRAIWIGLGRVPDVEKDIPAIVVEFVSRSRRDYRRDYEEKLVEYLAIGVREYWIIDRFRRIMTIHRNHADGSPPIVIGEADTYRTDLLPGFDLPLARLLARADHWPASRHRLRKPPGGDAH